MSPERPARGGGDGRSPRRDKRGGGDDRRPPRDRDDARRDDRRGPPRRDDRGGAPKREVPRDRPPATPVDRAPARRVLVPVEITPPPEAEWPQTEEKRIKQNGADAAWENIAYSAMGEEFAKKLRNNFGFLAFENAIRTYGNQVAVSANRQFVYNFSRALRDAFATNPTILETIEAQRETIDKMALENPLLTGFTIGTIDTAIDDIKNEQRTEREHATRTKEQAEREATRKIEIEERAKADAERIETARVATEKELEQKKIEADNAWADFGNTIGNPAAAAKLRTEFGFARFEKAVASDPRRAQAANKSLKEYLTIALSDEPTFSEAFRGQGRALLALIEANPFFKDGQLDTSFVKQLTEKNSTKEGGKDDGKKKGSEKNAKGEKVTEKDTRTNEEKEKQATEATAAWKEFEETIGEPETALRLRTRFALDSYCAVLHDRGLGAGAVAEAYKVLEAEVRGLDTIEPRVSLELVHKQREALTQLFKKNPYFTGLSLGKLVLLSDRNAAFLEPAKKVERERKEIEDIGTWPLEPNILAVLKEAIVVYTNTNNRKDFATKIFLKFLAGDEVAVSEEISAALKPVGSENSSKKDTIKKLQMLASWLPNYKELAYISAAKKRATTAQDTDFITTSVIPFLAAERADRPTTKLATTLSQREGTLNPDLVQLVKLILEDSTLIATNVEVPVVLEEPPTPPTPRATPDLRLVPPPPDTSTPPPPPTPRAPEPTSPPPIDDTLTADASDTKSIDIAFDDDANEAPPSTDIHEEKQGSTANNIAHTEVIADEEQNQHAIVTDQATTEQHQLNSAAHDKYYSELVGPLNQTTTALNSARRVEKSNIYHHILRDAEEAKKLDESIDAKKRILYSINSLTIREIVRLERDLYQHAPDFNTFITNDPYFKDDLGSIETLGRLIEHTMVYKIAASTDESYRGSKKEFLDHFIKLTWGDAHDFWDKKLTEEIWDKLVSVGYLIQETFFGIARDKWEARLSLIELAEKLGLISKPNPEPNSNPVMQPEKPEPTPNNEHPTPPPSTVKTPDTPGPQTSSGDITFAAHKESTVQVTDKTGGENVDVNTKNKQTLEQFIKTVGDMAQADHLLYGSGLAAYLEILKKGGSIESATLKAKNIITDFPGSCPTVVTLDRYTFALTELLESNPYLKQANLTVDDIIKWQEAIPQPIQNPDPSPSGDLPIPEEPRDDGHDITPNFVGVGRTTTPSPDTRPATSSTTGNQETSVAKTVLASDTARRYLRDKLNNNELYQRIRHDFGIGEYIRSIQNNLSPENALAAMKEAVSTTRIYKLPSKSEILSNRPAITEYLASDPYTKGLTFDMLEDLAVYDGISMFERQKEDALTFMLVENKKEFQKGISEKKALQLLTDKFGKDAKDLWRYIVSTGKIKETGILFNKKWFLKDDSTVA